MSTVNGHSKKEAYEDHASTGHTTNLKQSILKTFDINVSHNVVLLKSDLDLQQTHLSVPGNCCEWFCQQTLD
jgi:hypothetical protein